MEDEKVTINAQELKALCLKAEYYDSMVEYNYEMGNYIGVQNCNHTACKSYEVGNGWKDSPMYFHCKDMIYCDKCGESFCDRHYQPYRQKEYDEEEYFCDDCLISVKTREEI